MEGRERNGISRYLANFEYYSEAHEIYSRLDYFFIFKDDITRVKKCEIEVIILGDHAPI